MPPFMFVMRSPSGRYTELELLTYWVAAVNACADDWKSEWAARVTEAEADIRAATAAARALERADERLARELERAACPPTVRDRLVARRKAAADKRSAAFVVLLERGLRRRVGLVLIAGSFERHAYEWVRERCGEAKPAGVAACERCGRVFEPQRKRYAWRCEPCNHATKGRELPLRASENERGGQTLTGLYGEVWVRTNRCEVCGWLFDAHHRDARTCSPACAKSLQRGGRVPAEALERQALIDAQEKLMQDYPDYREAWRASGERQFLARWLALELSGLAGAFRRGMLDDDWTVFEALVAQRKAAAPPRRRTLRNRRIIGYRQGGMNPGPIYEGEPLRASD